MRKVFCGDGAWLGVPCICSCKATGEKWREISREKLWALSSCISSGKRNSKIHRAAKGARQKGIGKGNEKREKGYQKVTEKAKKIVSGLPASAYPLLRHVAKFHQKFHGSFHGDFHAWFQEKKMSRQHFSSLVRPVKIWLQCQNAVTLR